MKNIFDLSKNCDRIQKVNITIKKGNNMAKKSKIAKYKKQVAMVEQYREIRQELKAAGKYQELAKLPRDSSPVRLHHRDQLDGRPRGYMRKFGMSRVNFRQLASKGQIPGVKKSSW